MKTIKHEAKIIHEIKKSKFIGYIKPISSKQEAEDFIEKINSKNPDASHNVYAYKVTEDNREYFKFSDDGEPQNTAGKPVAELINIMDLTNIVIVISRYFGGIKLGAGGLIRHYSKAGKLAIKKGDIIEYIKKREIVLDFGYEMVDIVDNILTKSEQTEILDKDYKANVTYRIKTGNKVINELKQKRGIILVSN
ncbi:MAG: IMPACT family protein [Fusobacteriota bacterium]